MIILRDRHPAEPEKLWEIFRDHLCDDLRRRLIRRHWSNDPTIEDVYDYGLYLIDCMLKNYKLALIVLQHIKLCQGLL